MLFFLRSAFRFHTSLSVLEKQKFSCIFRGLAYYTLVVWEEPGDEAVCARRETEVSHGDGQRVLPQQQAVHSVQAATAQLALQPNRNLQSKKFLARKPMKHVNVCV